MANLIKHKDDHGFPAEWHFYATAHGEHAYDGIGATTVTSPFQWDKNAFL